MLLMSLIFLERKPKNESENIADFILFVPLAVFADTETFECNYTSYSNEKGNHKITGDFKLTFISDKKENKSYLLGNNGSSPVERFETKNHLLFLEVTKTLNMMTTVIDSEYNSVHSRSPVLTGKVIPSQYYGKCKNI